MIFLSRESPSHARNSNRVGYYYLIKESLCRFQKILQQFILHFQADDEVKFDLVNLLNNILPQIYEDIYELQEIIINEEKTQAAAWVFFRLKNLYPSAIHYLFIKV